MSSVKHPVDFIDINTASNPKKRVVVTGMGCVSPLGNDLQSTWNSILEGKSGAATITHFDASVLDVRFACEVKGFDPEKYIPKKELRRMDRFIHLGFAAAMQAIESAKLDDSKIPLDRISVILGSGMGGLPMIEVQHKIALEKPNRVSPFLIPAIIPNMLAGQVSIVKGYKGLNVCTVSACSSSAHAIGEAKRMIEHGHADVVVAGGAESTICLLGIAGFANMKALSTRNDAPDKASRPFDVGRDGFVMGEGGAVLILESLESAERRGAEILAEFVGYGANADAFHMTQPSEGGEGAGACMKLALQDAYMAAADVDHVNMHGTSTPAGDVAESMAVESVFGDKAAGLNCVSTKSMTGHLLGAAGAIESIFSIMALKEQIVPPTINIENQDPNCRLNYTAHKPVKREIRAALSNSFGFGGTNVSLLFKRV